MTIPSISSAIFAHAELRPLAEEDWVMIWTREMVHALPDDGNRYELFDGEGGRG